MGGCNSKENMSKLIFDVTTSKRTESLAIQPIRRMTESYLVIWVDVNINSNNKDCQNIIQQLRAVVNEVEQYTTIEQCIHALMESNDKTVFIISSGALGQFLVPEIHSMSQLDSIFIFSLKTQSNEVWIKNWAKIKGVYTSIEPICELLSITSKEYNQSNIPVSIISAHDSDSSANLDQLEPTFMYTQIFKEILLDMEYDQRDITDLGNYCKEIYKEDKTEIEIIKEFECSYESSKAVWWYTRECFTYKMLNRALRTLNGDIITRMGFFLRDTYRQIESLHRQQIPSYGGKVFTTYRGQGLSTVDFEKLSNNISGLMSFNNFLSTSTHRRGSLSFAYGALGTSGMVGILFHMTIDPCVPTTPFASIKEMSYIEKEDEILFAMHTVFRISGIAKLDQNRELYQVDLKLTSDDDQQLHRLTESIRKEASGPTGWFRLGKLLLKIGQYGKAEELYTALLQQRVDDEVQAFIYHELGGLQRQQGRYKEAAEFYQKSLKIKERTLSEDDSTLASIYANLGTVYINTASYPQALEYYHKAHQIFEKTLPKNHLDLATSYNNIASLYFTMGDYSKVLEYYKKALKIKEISLPENHPELAILYNNIGSAYLNMGIYAKVLEYYNKALKIFEQTLPENHPTLAASYYNLGQVYNNMEDYLKAAKYYKKAVKIRETSLPETHLDLAASYAGMGEVYNKMGNYSQALEYHNRAQKILEVSLSENHPDLAVTYGSIGELYNNTGDYSKALEYYTKTQKILEICLPENHSDLAILYNNIGLVSANKNDHLNAVEYYNRALKIFEEISPAYHPNLATLYKNIGKVYTNIPDYPKALEYYNKALKIKEISLPENHPDLAILYGNIAQTYENINNNSNALLFAEKALSIQQQSLPPSHPHIKVTIRMIKSIKAKM
ncbi:unnamed protein product [Rotaria magnacalcarata]|uniref:Uncharacterized protein n=1 Tax=Rotaria magnacalcarata TaxID=392030 RepID=A0A816YT46_9BILA|nr:unnamed protein product [Rotaria magnacalcarata]CAF4191444.1 unnamed protein product [Rotaria magnacalcarata]